VINADGFIRHSRIYEGNKPDTATLADMLGDLKKHASPSAKQTVVIDAGIATEENLELLRQDGYSYVCVSRKRMKEYAPAPGQTPVVCLTDREKNEVKLSIFKPDGYQDTWMCVQSDAKRTKERSMADKLNQRFEQDIKSAQDALQKKGGTKKLVKVWERIGKLKEKHKRVSGQYDITISDKDGIVQDISWVKKQSKAVADKENGVYFIRTNIESPQEAHLWQIYNTIREVESTFRCLKSDLNIRPIHHQTDERIKSHIYLTILAYQLVNTIRYMLKQKGLNYDWANILRLMATQTIQTIELPTDKKTIHLRKPSKPDQLVREIYKATNCQNTIPPIKKYVVYH
jgi:transposase